MHCNYTFSVFSKQNDKDMSCANPESVSALEPRKGHVQMRACVCWRKRWKWAVVEMCIVCTSLAPVCQGVGTFISFGGKPFASRHRLCPRTCRIGSGEMLYF